MLNRLKAYLAPPETKTSQTARLIAVQGAGRARWTPRDYAALAREGYLGNAIVHRCIRLIAENAAACSFLVYEGVREVDTHPLAQLLTRPNPRQDGAAMFEMLYAHLLLAGNAYVEGVALDDGVRELYALRPDRMKVVPGEDGWAEAYEYSVNGRSVRYDQHSARVPPILHLTFYHPLDDHYGLAPIEAAAVAVDAATQISVLDLTRTAPPSSPVEGQRHIVASGPTGTWVGHAKAIATWQDGAWAFLAPNAGWSVWSIADGVMFVYDGAIWRDQRNLAVDNVARLGVNTAASAPNLLSVKSNAALLTAINAADGGSGDVRLQLSKESAAKTASVVFSNNYSGRAEFGLVGSDAFKLKVSADGASFVDALAIDQTTGNLALPRGLTLSGVIAPSQITANQNDYAPAGFASASVLQLSTDAARNITGLAGGSDGRVVGLINIGAQMLTLLTDSVSSSAVNRLALGSDMPIPPKQAALLRYDGAAARWQALSRPFTGALIATNNLSDLLSAAMARSNLGIRDALAANRTYYVRTDGNDGNTGLADSAGGAFLTIQKAVDAVAALDLSIWQATIQIKDGTFTGTVFLKPYVGALPPIIQGNSATPANVLLNVSSSAITNDAGGVWRVRDLKLQSGLSGLSAKNGGDIRFQNLDFGACAYHIRADAQSRVVATGSCAISAAASSFHAYANGGVISYGGSNFTFTLAGSQTYSIFVIATNIGFIDAAFTTFTGGTVTGGRYLSARNSVIETNGGGANFFPGNAAGSTTLGGLYI